MSYNFLPYNQDQQFLLPPDLQDWVKEDSLERFVSDVVDHLDAEGRLEPFYEGYREDGWGHPAYHPVLLVKVLIYGYAIGVRSSRKLARLLERDVAFRYLAANQQPDSGRSATSVRSTGRRSRSCLRRSFCCVGKRGWRSWSGWPWTAAGFRGMPRWSGTGPGSRSAGGRPRSGRRGRRNAAANPNLRRRWSYRRTGR